MVYEKVKNIKKVIEELNKPYIQQNDDDLYDEDCGSIFNFEIWKDNNKYYIADRNENYNYNYENDMNYELKNMCSEFGYKFEPYTDMIYPKLLDAVKKDFGEEAFIEWENNIVMLIVE